MRGKRQMFFFSHIQRRVTCPLRTAAHGGFVSTWTVHLRFNMAVNTVLVKPAMFVMCLMLWDLRLTVDPVRQCGLMKQARGVSVLISPFGLYFPSFIYSACLLHSSQWRLAFFSSYSAVDCLSLWAAIEPVWTCPRTEAILVLHISWMDLLRLVTVGGLLSRFFSYDLSIWL